MPALSSLFADALRDAFTPRAALLACGAGHWRVCGPGFLLPQLFSLRGQDVITEMRSRTFMAQGYVAPADQLLRWSRPHFLGLEHSGSWGRLWRLPPILAIMAMCLLKPPAGENIRFGLTQAEWFTLGLFLVSVVCIVLPRRFFLHYALLLLPVFPLMVSVLVARCSALRGPPIRWPPPDFAHSRCCTDGD